MANFRKGNNLLWPDSEVPYEIDGDDFPAGTTRRAKVEWAVDHWNSRCRVKFVHRVVGSRKNWVKFVKHSEACSSHVGRQSLFTLPFLDPPPQLIRCRLAGSSFPRGSIVHEMGHAVGLFHEHQRPDRDAFVSVSSTDSTNYGKKKPSEVILNTPYDYLSIMHYPRTSSLTVANNQPIGQRDRLSYLDIASIEYRYEIGGGDHWLIPALHVGFS